MFTPSFCSARRAFRAIKIPVLLFSFKTGATALVVETVWLMTVVILIVKVISLAVWVKIKVTTSAT